MALRKNQLTDEELIQKMQEYYLQGNGIRINDFSAKNGLPHFQVYIKRFGSWNDAKIQAGIYENLHSTKRYNKEDIIKMFQDYTNVIGRIPSLTELEKLEGFPRWTTIYNHFKDYYDLIKQSGLETNREYGSKFKQDYLINEIKRFVKEFSKVPTPKDFENLEGYPARKTFTNHFGNFNNVVVAAGFEPAYIPVEKKREIDKNTYTKDFLISEIHRFVNEFEHTPTIKEMENNISFPSREKYRKVFGTWNNALKEAGLSPNVSQHSDEFLEQEFHRFVNRNGRIPNYSEFNNSEYPSFWCYQHRFGSWNKAVMAYGYEPNDSNRKYILDDGEICVSSYEFDTSNWLKSKDIQYERNVPYKDFINGYKGKMDCDYLIKYNNQTWYVEVAGFLSDRDKISEIERVYFFKLKYKEKLLKRQGVNHLIIKVRDLKNKTFEEMFYFIK